MMKKRISNLTVSTLRVEEMFNVRGGDDEGTNTKTNTGSTANSTAKGEDEDIIL